jgi:hypothetical protein
MAVANKGRLEISGGAATAAAIKENSGTSDGTAIAAAEKRRLESIDILRDGLMQPVSQPFKIAAIEKLSCWILPR